MIPHMNIRSAKFNICIPVIMANEGGLMYNRLDTGGLTKYGISQRSYPHLDISHLAASGAESIYFRDFWLPMNCEEIPIGLDVCVLDFGINAGPAPAARTLQRLLDVQADGHIGPATLAATSSTSFTAESLIEAYSDARLRFYQVLRAWDTYGNGWTKRVERVRVAALNMLAKS